MLKVGEDGGYTNLVLQVGEDGGYNNLVLQVGEDGGYTNLVDENGQPLETASKLKNRLEILRT